jgi:small subunit ribosomal protein S7
MMDMQQINDWRRRRTMVLMVDGKRSVAESRVNDARRRLRESGHQDPALSVANAREAVMPSVETVSVKRGGASYQVPHPRHQSRRQSLAVRWVVEGARSRVRKGIGISRALANEVHAIGQDLAVMKAEGTAKTPSSFAMNKKASRHRTAKANRVFAHLRWR